MSNRIISKEPTELDIFYWRVRRCCTSAKQNYLGIKGKNTSNL